MRNQVKQSQLKNQHLETEANHQQNYKNDKQTDYDQHHLQNGNQKDHFITEIPIETQRQLDRLKEKHRKRMQEEREMYKQNQQQKEQEEQQVEYHVKNEQKIPLIPLKYSKSDHLRQESIQSIEFGKQRRQKMILVNLNKLQNKLNQDAQKIDETIDLIRIEITETQKEIKEKAKIEREEMQDYHNSMHKQISDLLKMKYNILHNQQQIQISQIKSKPKRDKRSISESQIRKHDNSFLNVDQKMNFNGQNFGMKDFKNFNSGQKSEQQISNISDHHNEDESFFYSEERSPRYQESNQQYSQDQYTFNEKPLYVKMEEKYQSNVVLPEIQQRNDVIKQRSEFYRKRMDPIKLFKDHERKYEGVKEEKEQQRTEKIQKNQQEIKQYSQERYTQSQTYVKVLNEEHQKKENQKKKEIIQKVLLQKQRNYFPSISDSSRIKRSQSSSEISQSLNFNYLDNSNRKPSQINYASSNNQEKLLLTEKEKKLMRMENHKEDLANKEIIYKTNEGSNDQSLLEMMIPLNSEKLTSIEQSVGKKSKRKILTQKFHGDNSPLPEVFVTDDFQSSEKKKISKQNKSQDLIEGRREPQIATSAFEINFEQKEQQTNQKNTKSQNEIKTQEQNNDNFSFQSNSAIKKNQNESRQRNNVLSSPIKNQIKSQQKQEDTKNQTNDQENSENNNRTKTPNVQILNSKNTVVEQKIQQKSLNGLEENKQQIIKNEKVQNDMDSIIEQSNHQKDQEKASSKPQDKSNQKFDQKQNNVKIQTSTAHFQQGIDDKNLNSQSHQVSQNKKDQHLKNENNDYDKKYQSGSEANVKQDQQQHSNQQIKIEKQFEDLQKQPEKSKNNSKEIQKLDDFDNRQDLKIIQNSSRIKRSPQNLIRSKERSQQNLASNNLNLQAEKVQQNQQQQQNQQIQQLYRQFKQIKNKSGRSASENSHNQNDYLKDSKLVDQLNQKKYKDYMKDVKLKFKLERQIDDWKKIDESQLLNDQQKIMKISKKVQYLDTKLQQMKELAKHNKRNQLISQSEKQDEDAILINSVQAKLAILNKLN